MRDTSKDTSPLERSRQVTRRSVADLRAAYHVNRYWLAGQHVADRLDQVVA
jgi:hypothetical protein